MTKEEYYPLVKSAPKHVIIMELSGAKLLGAKNNGPTQKPLNNLFCLPPSVLIIPKCGLGKSSVNCITLSLALTPASPLPPTNTNFYASSEIQKWPHLSMEPHETPKISAAIFTMKSRSLNEKSDETLLPQSTFDSSITLALFLLLLLSIKLLQQILLKRLLTLQRSVITSTETNGTTTT